MLAFIEYLRAHLRMVVKICLVLLACLVLGDALLVDKEHAHTWAERLPGFWTVFGFVGCALLIILSKWFGHAGIMTREEYYDD